MITLSLLGAGNVGTHLFDAFNKAKDIDVKQWYARDIEQIYDYNNVVAITDELNDLEPADIYVLAVSDDAIAELSSKLPFEDRLVVHTSGSLNIHELDRKHRRGVLYPLQTLSKGNYVDFAKVPLCIEAFIKEDLEILKTVAKYVGSPFFKINTEQRQTLHLAAVFVNNFNNQIYRVAHEICESKNIEFEVLKPLIQETANKIEHLSPYQAQTGPAMRRDKKTLKRHLKLIESEHHKAIYKLLTQSIQKTHYGK